MQKECFKAEGNQLHGNWKWMLQENASGGGGGLAS